ncbi:MAG: hypothetical protein E6G09_12180 [Actinobacteria bacterium]|nr:MAG: hypothetical protein E6G09_12180 [Actinomycetota bacterium]
MDEGLRLHLALCKVAERLAGVMEGARLERRDGYVLMTFPTLPIPSFNGVWPEDDSAAGALRDTITEIEATGIGAGVLARSGKMPAVEEAARVLGLTAAERIPGMVVNAGDLDRPATTELEVVRVETADGFAQALALAAEGFGLPADLLAPLYMLEVTGLDGFDVYLGGARGFRGRSRPRLPAVERNRRIGVSPPRLPRGRELRASHAPRRSLTDFLIAS